MLNDGRKIYLEVDGAEHAGSEQDRAFHDFFKNNREGNEFLVRIQTHRTLAEVQSFVHSLETTEYDPVSLLVGCQDGEPHISSAKVTLVDGVPGCGKTKEILSRVNFDEDLVLVPGKQAAEMIRRRANSSGLIVATKENVRTLDSFLMNYGRGPCQYKRAVSG